MRHIFKTGFTVVELLIGVSAAAILALAAGSLLANTYRGWGRGVAAADMERDAAVAVHTLEIAIRGASNTVSGEVGVDKLKIRDPDGRIRSFTVATASGRRSLLYNPGGPTGLPMVLVDQRLETFEAAATGKMVRITMTVKGMGPDAQDTGLVMGYSNVWIKMRN